MKKIQASVFIITKNEENNIARCLKSVKDFEEIIVVDSGSEDQTIEIAKKNGATLFYQDWLGYAKQKQFALEKCKMDWVLNLDADEEISQDAVNYISEVIENNTCNGLEFKMYNYFLGKRPNKLSASMKKIRFAKRNSVHYDIERSVHESMIIDGLVKKSKGYIYHYGENSIHIMIEKINNYSTLRARNKSYSHFIFLFAIFTFIFGFLKSYIIKRNFLNGQRGFIGSFIIGFYEFLKKAKNLE